MKKIFIDHLGVKYETLSAMAKAWNINFFTLRSRLEEKKWSVEKALTHPNCHTGKRVAAYAQTAAQKAESRKKHYESLICKDHKGVEHPNITKMCEAWGVSVQAFLYRRKEGYPLDICLDKDINLYRLARNAESEGSTDHLGVTYPSIKEMCEAWGVHHHTFYSRRDQCGMSLEDALICPLGILPTFVMSGDKKYFFVNKKKFNSPAEAADYYKLHITPEDFDGMTDEEICEAFARVRPHKTAKTARTARCLATDPIHMLKSWGIDPDTAKSLAKQLKIPKAKAAKNFFSITQMFKEHRICPRIVEPYSSNRWNYGLFSVSECALSPRAFAKVLKERFGC